MDVYKLVRERDGHACRACGLGQTVEVHHIIFRSQGGPDETWNLISLCRECHEGAHGRGALIQPWELHLMVLTGLTCTLAGMKQLLAQSGYLAPAVQQRADRLKVCLSCKNMTFFGFCKLWEHDVDWGYGCNAWSPRMYWL